MYSARPVKLSPIEAFNKANVLLLAHAGGALPADVGRREITMPVPGERRDGVSMQVICTDGTVLQCQRFEAIDSGVLLFTEQQRTEAREETEEEEEEGVEEEATAFVPLHQLRFVLPEGLTPSTGGGQAMGQQMQGQPQPGGAPIPSQGQMAAQQQMGAQSPPQQTSGQPPTQQGPGQRR